MFTQNETQPGPPPPRRGSELLLSDHHHRLEATCRDLLARAHTDDPRALALSWIEVEAELLDHMAAEEELILPAYAVHAPEDARRIRAAHLRIQELVTPIGVDVELHEVRLARLRQLVELLEAHSASEDAAMYPWAVRNLALVRQRMLYVRIGRWLARA